MEDERVSRRSQYVHSLRILVIGVLKGYDPLLNLVMDQVEEFVRAMDADTEEWKLTESKRDLGLVVIRGPALILISPLDGMEEIENPFATAE